MPAYDTLQRALQRRRRMTTITAGAPSADASKFPAGVDVFVMLAIDEVAPRSHDTERIAVAISVELPPSLRAEATHLAVGGLLLKSPPSRVYCQVKHQIPYILGWKVRRSFEHPDEEATE